MLVAMQTTTSTTSVTAAARRRADEAPLARPRLVPGIGDAVVAEDGYLGRVDEVVLTADGSLAYIVVSVGPFWRRRRPVVSSALVASVARQGSHVLVRGGRAVLKRLPEALPIVI